MLGAVAPLPNSPGRMTFTQRDVNLLFGVQGNMHGGTTPACKKEPSDAE